MSDDNTLIYRPLIKPFENRPLAPEGDELEAPDRRDGRIYEYDDLLKLVVEMALATGRPLLLRGEPGSGKSSLAAYIAANLGYRYYEAVITSQSAAQDLLWKYDLVRRLADAQARGAGSRPTLRNDTRPTPLSDYDYIEPGVLWWVFDPDSARARGWTSESTLPQAPAAAEPNEAMNKARDKLGAVVLIDEIDKADPDLPNALLVPLGSLRFPVTDIRDRPVHVKMAQGGAIQSSDGRRMSRLLVVITTNEERELPPAFVRRCIVHKLEHPSSARLVRIARLHFHRPPTHPFGPAEEKIAQEIAKDLDELRTRHATSRRRLPGTAEYLDAVRAAIALDVQVGGGPTWEALQRSILLKDEGLQP
mgnify:CR=1 FL=1